MLSSKLIDIFILSIIYIIRILQCWGRNCTIHTHSYSFIIIYINNFHCLSFFLQFPLHHRIFYLQDINYLTTLKASCLHKFICDHVSFLIEKNIQISNIKYLSWYKHMIHFLYTSFRYVASLFYQCFPSPYCFLPLLWRVQNIGGRKISSWSWKFFFKDWKNSQKENVWKTCRKLNLETKGCSTSQYFHIVNSTPVKSSSISFFKKSSDNILQINK